MLGASKATTTREYQLLDTGTITSTGSQSYTIPAGTLYLEIECWGAGGGGGGRYIEPGPRGYSYYAGAGGGGGAYFKYTYYGDQDMLANDTLNFTVGAGGVGGVTSVIGDLSDAGDTGVPTSLDTHKRSTTTINTFVISAGGGVGGESDVSSYGGVGGAPIWYVITPDAYASGDAGTRAVGQNGGDGGDGADPNGGAGGDGGAGGVGATNADNGTVPGGGGGGANGSNWGSDHDSGSGADGKVIVKAYG
jgi:hypothetical protein